VKVVVNSYTSTPSALLGFVAAVGAPAVDRVPAANLARSDLHAPRLILLGLHLGLLNRDGIFDCHDSTFLVR
jgi:hypothetical protein